MALTVGIDLGTTYTVIAYIDSQTKNPVIIKNKYGNPTTPSAVGFNPDGTYVIGQDAKDMEEMGDTNTVAFYKLHMGDHNFRVPIYGRSYTAADLSSLFLKRAIEDAEKEVGDKITKAVITVPAYFEDAAKNDTLRAGQQAGLNVLNIINEPTAACVAYGLNDSSKEKNILIYDLGGGTFDITVAKITKDNIRVLGTNGHHQLGGKDWDMTIVDWIVDEFSSQTGTDVSANVEFTTAHVVKAEKAKKILSTATSTDIIADDGEDKIRLTLTRKMFEEMTSFKLRITTDLIDTTFNEIGITWNDIDGAVLVGGSTKMPMVRNYITGKGIPILEGVHPDEAVAIGAAIQANISNFCALLPGAKEKSSFLLSGGSDVNLTLLPGAKIIKDVISHSLGMVVTDVAETRFVNDIMIKRNTPIENAHTTKTRELKVSRKKENNKLDIYLMQGESDVPSNCTVAKKYSFYDIDYVNGGKTMIKVTYSHTINGTIDIRAVQTETSKALKFREEEIESDLSWLDKSPQEVFGSSTPVIPGTLVMALDVSGSMSGNPLKEAKAAMKNFAAELVEKDIMVGVIGFGNRCAPSCDPTDDLDVVNRAIDALECGRISPSAPKNGGMDLGGGTSANPMPMMLECLDKGEKGEFMYAIALTDGVWLAQKEALAYKPKFVKKEYEIVGMGFGSADIRFLRKLSTKSELAKVDDISKLNANLSSIARMIN